MCLMLRTHTIELGLIYRGISFYHIPSDVQNFRNQILKLIPDQPENFKALDSNIFSYMQKKQQHHEATGGNVHKNTLKRKKKSLKREKLF